MITATYAAAEKQLTANGFKMEFGMPLTGVRFKSESQIAIVFRIAPNTYETAIYDIIAEA